MQNKNQTQYYVYQRQLISAEGLYKNDPRNVHLLRNDTLNNERNIRTEGTLQRNESN